MIKAEIFQGAALLLDESGRIWEVVIGNDDQPEIRMLNRVERETINSLMQPSLSRALLARF